MDLIKYTNRLLKESGDKEMIKNFYSLHAFIGNLIFAKRVAKDLTQMELANLIGEPVQVIHRVEGGGGTVALNTYETIFEALDISYYEIATWIAEQAKQFDES